MRGNRRRDTKPELKLRAALHKRGLRCRVDYPVQAGSRRVRANVVFMRQRVAVFLDSCFWHRCADHGVLPRANSDYWRPKLDRNVERDLAVDAGLVRDEWL
jgi:DNA mismatch endonuclease, patch repair protein